MKKAPTKKVVINGLNRLLAERKPGQTFSHREIQEATGLTRGGVWMLEQRALRHLREAFRKQFGLGYEHLCDREKSGF